MIGLFSFYIFSNTFAVFDKNQDGSIDFKEFLLAIVSTYPQSVEEKVDLFFKWLVRLSVVV